MRSLCARFLRAGIVCLGLAAAGQATTVQIQNIEAFVHFEASATPQDTLSIGSPTFTSQLDAGSLGNFLFTWQNMPGSEITDLTFTVFFDADIAGADNTYFNEYGEFISLAFPVLARVDAITPAGWEIDEPEYVHGRRGGDAWRRAAAAWKALYDEKPDSLDRKRELARSYQFLARALSRAVKREEARETALLANLSAQLKRYADAVPLFQEQIRLREKLSAKDPNNLNALMGIAGTMDRTHLPAPETARRRNVLPEALTGTAARRAR